MLVAVYATSTSLYRSTGHKLQEASLDNPLIEFKNITKSFGTVRALDNVTMHVNQARSGRPDR